MQKIFTYIICTFWAIVLAIPIQRSPEHDLLLFYANHAFNSYAVIESVVDAVNKRDAAALEALICSDHAYDMEHFGDTGVQYKIANFFSAMDSVGQISRPKEKPEIGEWMMGSYLETFYNTLRHNFRVDSTDYQLVVGYHIYYAGKGVCYLAIKQFNPVAQTYDKIASIEYEGPPMIGG